MTDDNSLIITAAEVALIGREGPDVERVLHNAAVLRATLLDAIEFTLNALDDMTTEEFGRGADKPARDMLEDARKAWQEYRAR